MHTADTPLIVSLVVPCFNESAVVRSFYDRVTAVFAGLPHVGLELVYVDDGSTDDTAQHLCTLVEADARVVALVLSRNFGKEAALSAGLRASTGDAVIPIDVDLQDPPELIPAMIDQWRSGYEVVLAIRGTRAADSLPKRLSAAAFYRLHNLLSAIPIPRNCGDFRLMDRSVIEALNQLPESQRFMKGLFAWVGFKTTQITYDRPARTVGSSHYSVWRLWSLAIDGITSFTTVPLKIWTYIGMTGALTAFIYGSFIVARTLIHGKDIPGYASILVAIIFFGSLQLISVGLLGEYLSRVYVESKRRPSYLIRRIFRNSMSATPGAPAGSPLAESLTVVSSASHNIQRWGSATDEKTPRTDSPRRILVSSSVLQCLVAIALVSPVLSPTGAADLTYRLGHGPGGFQSHTVDLGADLVSTPLRWNLAYYKANGTDLGLEQFSGSLRWQVTKTNALTLGGRQIDDNIMLIKGLSVAAALNLDQYWQGTHETTVNLASSRLTYSPETQTRVAAAIINRFPEQTSFSFGITQGLPQNLTFSVNYDVYRYSEDPGDLAAAIALRFWRGNRSPPVQAFTLAGFPDRTHSAGISWSPAGAWSFDTFFSQTQTALDQTLRWLSLGVTHSNAALTLGSTISRSHASEVLGRRGLNTVIPASAGTYLEFRVSLAF